MLLMVWWREVAKMSLWHDHWESRCALFLNVFNEISLSVVQKVET